MQEEIRIQRGQWPVEVGLIENQPEWLNEAITDLFGRVDPGNIGRVADEINQVLKREELIENDDNWTGPAEGNQLTIDDITDGEKLILKQKKI